MQLHNINLCTKIIHSPFDCRLQGDGHGLPMRLIYVHRVKKRTVFANRLRTFPSFTWEILPPETLWEWVSSRDRGIDKPDPPFNFSRALRLRKIIPIINECCMRAFTYIPGKIRVEVYWVGVFKINKGHEFSRRRHTFAQPKGKRCQVVVNGSWALVWIMTHDKRSAYSAWRWSMPVEHRC